MEPKEPATWSRAGATRSRKSNAMLGILAGSGLDLGDGLFGTGDGML
jgi:hypothetical protein